MLTGRRYQKTSSPLAEGWFVFRSFVSVSFFTNLPARDPHHLLLYLVEVLEAKQWRI